VFPDGEMLSFPIPGTDDKTDSDKISGTDEIKDRKDSIEYSDLRFSRIMN
jgi:hypothetical protein